MTVVIHVQNQILALINNIQTITANPINPISAVAAILVAILEKNLFIKNVDPAAGNLEPTKDGESPRTDK